MRTIPRPADQPHPQLSLVVPCFNESAGLAELHRRLTAVAEGTGLSYEIVLVDDGSRDDTADRIADLAERDPRVRGVSLSRNFGHQAALSAGMQHAAGQVVVTLDADLQHPPEFIPEMIAQWQAGFDVVYAFRRNRKPRLGYRLLNWLCHVQIPSEAADFRLMDRAALDALLDMPERQRFLRGMVAWLGFRQTGIPYDQAERFTGERKYTFRQTFRLLGAGVFSFSSVPLRMAAYLGLATLGCGLLYALYILAALIIRPATIPSGWPATIMSVLILGGVQLLCLGAVAEYVGRIYEEVKRRPLYVVRRLIGRTPTAPPGDAATPAPSPQEP